MRLTNILCAVDYSAGSRTALAVARRLADEHDAELVIVNVCQLPTATIGPELPISPELIAGLVDDAQRALDAMVAEVAKQRGGRVTGKLVHGAPWSAIVDAAAELAASLVVVGSAGRTGLARLLIGSVAEMVVRHAPCAVLVVRGDRTDAPFGHVLCPVDFSASSQRALHFAATMCRAGDGDIELLHALELPAAYRGELAAPALAPELARDLDRRSSELLERTRVELAAKTSRRVSAHHLVGSPSATILGALERDRRFDLVVMGSHGRTGLARALLGSVAEKVVRHAHCSVLVARR